MVGPPPDATGSVPHILLACPDASLLHQALCSDFLGSIFHLCMTYDEVEYALPYCQTVITNTEFIEGQRASLITLARSQKPVVPVIITVNPLEKAAAVRALEKGVFDCISTPVDTAKAVESVRRALWLYQLRMAIARHKQTLVIFQQRHTAFSAGDSPPSEHPVQVVDHGTKQMEATLAALKLNIATIQTSVTYLTETASALQAQAREQALHCLMTL